MNETGKTINGHDDDCEEVEEKEGRMEDFAERRRRKKRTARIQLCNYFGIHRTNVQIIISLVTVRILNVYYEIYRTHIVNIVFVFHSFA